MKKIEVGHMDSQTFRYVVSMLSIRTKLTIVESNLVQRGYSIDEAKEIINTTLSPKVNPFKRQGLKRMAWGGLIFGIGFVLTAVTYSAGSGGRYLLFYGPIAVGGVYALVGLIQYRTGWEIS